MSDWFKITAKFNSTCLECNGEINAGDVILWLKGTGTKHTECPEAVQPVHELEVEEDYTTWFNQQTYEYKQLNQVNQCQKCGAQLRTGQVPMFVDASEMGNRRVCEDCFDKKHR